MKKVEAMRAITRAYNTLKEIETDKDLQRAGLSLSDYRSARDIFPELSTPGTTATTFIKGVADFYKKAGFIVSAAGINYNITTA